MTYEIAYRAGAGLSQQLRPQRVEGKGGKKEKKKKEEDAKHRPSATLSFS